jgi:hypothetical protein
MAHISVKIKSIRARIAPAAVDHATILALVWVARWLVSCCSMFSTFSDIRIRRSWSVIKISDYFHFLLDFSVLFVLMYFQKGKLL